jgi:hypothetical protein
MIDELSLLRISEAAKGNLKYLKIYELKASFFILGVADNYYIISKLLYFVVFHAKSRMSYYSMTFELPDLY